MVTRARRQFDIAQLLQLPSHGRFRQGHPELIMEPPRQVDQSPTHNSMDRRDRTAFNDLRKSLALGIAQQRGLARCLTIKEPVRTSIIEPHDPVPHDLQRHSADTRRIAAAPAIINFRQSQKPTALVRALGHARQSPQARGVKVVPHSDRCTHGHALQSTAIESEFRRFGNPPVSQYHRRLV